MLYKYLDSSAAPGWQGFAKLASAVRVGKLAWSSVDLCSCYSFALKRTSGSGVSIEVFQPFQVSCEADGVMGAEGKWVEARAAGQPSHGTCQGAWKWHHSFRTRWCGWWRAWPGLL